VLVLRETTERPELIDAGGGLLVGTDPDVLVGHVTRLWGHPAEHQAMRVARNPFGDGRASEYICDTLVQQLATTRPGL
jgi:UDP-N-acetylglucosamine 2-epimerase (non-hydrolysing)